MLRTKNNKQTDSKILATPTNIVITGNNDNLAHFVHSFAEFVDRDADTAVRWSCV